MENIAWGLYMTLAGMGTVFALLLVLMVVLIGVGRLDRPRPSSPPSGATPSGDNPDGGRADADDADSDDAEPAEPTQPDALSPELIAAISIAVITHAKVRRHQAAPAMRRVAPGSQLFASRWVAVGRSYQNRPWK